MRPTPKSPLFAIGDIHGCAVELHELIAKLPLTPDSTLVFLGDCIDRGNGSREAAETVLSLRRQGKVVCLMGNHEEMLLDFLSRSDPHRSAHFIVNGGGSTEASGIQNTKKLSLTVWFSVAKTEVTPISTASRSIKFFKKTDARQKTRATSELLATKHRPQPAR